MTFVTLASLSSTVRNAMQQFIQAIRDHKTYVLVHVAFIAIAVIATLLANT